MKDVLKDGKRKGTIMGKYSKARQQTRRLLKELVREHGNEAGILTSKQLKQVSIQTFEELRKSFRDLKKETLEKYIERFIRKYSTVREEDELICVVCKKSLGTDIQYLGQGKYRHKKNKRCTKIRKRKAEKALLKK